MAKSSREIRAQKAKLRSLLANGATEIECMEALGMRSISTVRALRQALLADELEETHDDTPGSLYIRYKWRMEGCIADLDQVIDFGKDKASSLNAVVGAIKAKAQILDNVVKRGQNLGVLPRAPAAKKPNEGKETKELEKRAADLKDELRELVGSYGSGDYADEDDEDLYLDFEEPAEEPVEEKAS